MFELGYTDTKALRTVFKKITGLTTVVYRNKYNKQVAAGYYEISPEFSFN